MRIDGVRIGARDVSEAAARYAVLLGTGPEPTAAGRLRFQLARGVIELEAGEPGVRSAVFAREPGDPEWPDGAGAYHGLDIRVEASGATAAAPHVSTAIDHVVVFTPDPARAIALWRDRLGLRLAFDREFPARGLRLLFFRSGGLTFEFACALPAPADGSAPDRFHGVSYRVADVAAHRATLLAAGFDVSEVRPGHKTGTQVATVRSGTSEVPTLLIEEAPRGG